MDDEKKRILKEIIELEKRITKLEKKVNKLENLFS